VFAWQAAKTRLFLRTRYRKFDLLGKLHFLYPSEFTKKFHLLSANSETCPGRKNNPHNHSMIGICESA